MVAGALLLVAVVAYLFTEAEARTRRIKVALERRVPDVQTRRSFAELRALRGRSERTRRDRVRIRDQQAEILKSLGRIEHLLGTALASPGR
jgi:phosphate starvation-inducible protein PhoH